MVDDGAEGEVDSGFGDFQGFGNTMQPVGLGGSLHHEETSVIEGDLDFLFGGFVFEEKPSLGTETEGSNGCVTTERLLVIAVPRHSLTAVFVEIE